jgi:flagellum-specific peptidoglycan hydrolase FlgJ
MRNVTDESVSIGQTMNEAKSDITTYVDTMGKSYRLNSEGMREYGGTLRSAREEITQFSDWEEREKAADKHAKVEDKATENLAKMDLERMNSRDALQSFVQLGVAPATRAMAALAKGTSTAASLLPGAGPAGENSVAGKLDAMNKAGAKPMVPSGAGAAPAGEAKPVSPGPKGKEQQAYYDKMYDSLLKEAKAAGLKNAEVVAKLGAAQTSLETGYGKHMVGNNAFGIKAKQGGASVGASTQEFENGRMVTKNQNFRAYDKPEDSAKDYIKFLQENKRYKDVLGSNNLSDAIAAQGKTGYATDPNYANKLAGIAGTYGNTSGPLNGYQSQTAGLNPSKTLPEKTEATQTAANLATAGDDKHADLLSQILGSLDNLNHSNQQIASSTKKSVQLQS